MDSSETPTDEAYTRHIAAVLVADVSGFSALMGVDDEGTARAVRRLQVLVGRVVAEFHGRAEPQAGDSILAIFESIAAAVEAAVCIQRQLLEKVTDPPVRLRIGVHFGDVLVSPDRLAFGDAINVASRLCALARPGTVCVSDGVHRHMGLRIDDPVEDLGRHRLKNISETVHAYLIVPRGAPRTARRRPPAIVWGVMVLALAATAATAWLWPRWTSGPAGTPASHTPRENPLAASVTPTVTLGVMLFKPLRDKPADAWMREALRDGLNTQLSGLSSVKVYSKEFIDFLITHEGLSEIEVANKLGIRKMLTGTFVRVGSTLRLEIHVVDVATGVLEASHTTTGTVADLLGLQTRLAEAVIARLDLPVTDDERRLLAARQASDVDALRLLMEAEGAGARPADQPEAGSGLFHLLPRWLLPATASADDREAIFTTLEGYRRAMEAQALPALAAAYVTFTPEQQAAQQRYFANAKNLKVTIADIDLAVVGDEAVVSYTRTDEFVDVRTGKPMHVSLRLTKTLKRTDAGWRLAAGG